MRPEPQVILARLKRLHAAALRQVQPRQTSECERELVRQMEEIMAKQNDKGGWDITDAEAAEIAAVSSGDKNPEDSWAYNPKRKRNRVDQARAAIALAFEGQGEAWSDELSGDRLAEVATRAIEHLLDQPPVDPQPEGQKRVHGYTRQPEWKVDLVNDVKKFENLLGDILNESAEHPEVDQRALTIARHQLQDGFMWLVRAYFQPESRL